MQHLGSYKSCDIYYYQVISRSTFQLFLYVFLFDMDFKHSCHAEPVVLIESSAELVSGESLSKTIKHSFQCCYKSAHQIFFTKDKIRYLQVFVPCISPTFLFLGSICSQVCRLSHLCMRDLTSDIPTPDPELCTDQRLQMKHREPRA